jgi:glutathione S-transferase
LREYSKKSFIVSIRPIGLGKPDQAKIASLKEQLNAKLDVYDKILAKQPYLAGQVK